MARITDSEGRLLGGLHSSHLPHPDSGVHDDHGVADGPRTRLSPMYGPEETVPGLACGYGTRAYSYTDRLLARPPTRFACHNPVEDPDERHHCALCGGDYCAMHAEPTAHDCAYIIRGG
ncbi:MAG: hypothetical protein JO250_02240 [Armatimonadetes bacterium]|nr:hypothetical protein [Armatimonadota bacterium]